MKHLILFFLVVCFGIVLVGCKKKEGCTDAFSPNYAPEAEKDDGSCEPHELWLMLGQHSFIPYIASFSKIDSGSPCRWESFSSDSGSFIFDETTYAITYNIDVKCKDSSLTKLIRSETGTWRFEGGYTTRTTWLGGAFEEWEGTMYFTNTSGDVWEAGFYYDVVLNYFTLSFLDYPDPGDATYIMWR